MKKFISVIPLICCILIMSSCSAAEKIFAKPQLSPTFTCTANIAYGDFNAKATLERFGDSVWSAEFSEPSSLSGVKLDFSDGEVVASYKGLSFSVPKDAVPVKAILSSLIEVVDGAMKSESLEGESKDGKITVSGSLSQGDYTIAFDEKTGVLLSFEMPGMNLKIDFEDFRAGTGQVTTTVTDVTAAPDTTAQTDSTEQTEQTAPAE